MSEIAVVAARKVRLQQRADEGDERARAALALAHDPNKFLSTVQIGITLIGIVAGAYSGASLGEPVAQRLQGLGLEAEHAKTAALVLVVAVAVLESRCGPLTYRWCSRMECS